MRHRSWLLLVAALVCFFLVRTAGAASLMLPEAELSLYFSQGGGAKRALLNAIDRAQTSIRVHSFFLSDREIATALIRAHARGVQVEAVLCRRGQLEALDAQGWRLVQAGIPVFLNGLYRAEHNKVMIFDAHTVQTGSYNYRFDADVLDAENVLFIRSPELAAVYMADYERHRGDARPFDLPLRPGRPRFLSSGATDGGYAPGHHLALRGVRVEAQFAPGGAKESILRHIHGARHEVVVHSYYLSDPDIAGALLAAKQRGVAVEALLSAKAPAKDPSPFLAASLVKAGIPVRLDAQHRNAHNKVIIYDRRIVQTGSYNLKQDVDRINAENILYVHSPDLALLYLASYLAHQAHSVAFAP